MKNKFGLYIWEDKDLSSKRNTFTKLRSNFEYRLELKQKTNKAKRIEKMADVT